MSLVGLSKAIEKGKSYDRTKHEYVLEGLVAAMNRTYEKVAAFEDPIATLTLNGEEKLIQDPSFLRLSEAYEILENRYESEMKKYLSSKGAMTLPPLVFEYVLENTEEFTDTLKKLPSGVRGKRQREFSKLIERCETETIGQKYVDGIYKRVSIS